MLIDQFDDQIVIPAMQLSLLGDAPKAAVQKKHSYFSAPVVDLDSYDNIVICMSGGKDSIACLLHLLDLGVNRGKLELWHNLVDGNEGSTLMDWKFMDDYNRKLAAHFGIPLYFSWLEGGFEAEMLKENSYGRPRKVETPDGLITIERDLRRMEPRTRMLFPQLSANLQVRWCSSELKIEVGRRALTNQDRFLNKKTLFITGERRDESANRAKYNQLEAHLCDTRDGRKRRHVDSWRPVLHWSEDRVWDKLREHGVIAPVPYRLGWPRSSCMNCIYNDATIWATIAHYFPDSIKPIASYEDRFGVTISRERINVLDLSRQATSLDIQDVEALEQARNKEYTLAIVTTPEKWQMPAGAFGKAGCGAV